MSADLTKQVVVLSTGNLINFEWACDALKDAGIPFFTRQETASGLRTAVPLCPAPQPGISWVLLVPETSVAAVQEILSTLPFEVRQKAGIWDFNPTPKVKLGWQIYFVIVLVLIAAGFLAQLF